MKALLKRWWFGLRGKDPEAIVVSFRSGDPALADAMCEEIRTLEPGRRHVTISAGESWTEVRRKLRPYRIGLAPVLMDGDRKYNALRSRAFFLAPAKILAYNSRLERYHLKPSAPVSSLLFALGVPLDRIHLRPRWLIPWRKDKTIRPTGHKRYEGRPRNPKRKSIAFLTPYFPYPLSHGGAVRMFNLLKETAREFDIVLYAFIETAAGAAGWIKNEDLAPVLAFVSRVYLVEKPRYREPRWSTLRPPEAGEYWSPEMAALIRSRDTDLLQTEYTYLAEYGGDILVEHDVTFDLYAQVRERKPALGTWWDWWRWRRFETRAVDRFRRVIAMSLKDAGILSAANPRLGSKPAETSSTGEPAKQPSRIRIIENGVDTVHFQPEPEISGRHLLFIGSFRHFPNIVAYRFLTEQILPLLTDHEFDLTVVAGAEPLLHWRNRVGTLRWPTDQRIRMFEFVADVRPLYHRANLVLVPTLESAGTNIKVLEAMAMQRAVISTSSGVAGLGLKHGHNVWIADKPADFAAAIEKLLGDDTLRLRVAQAGRACVEQNFSWRAIGLRQREMYRELLGDRLTIRPVRPEDIRRIVEIQVASPQASRWDAQSYLTYDCCVAECEGRVLGFLVSRHTGPGEREIMNLAVDPTVRGQGIARRLVEHELSTAHGQWFLEVRESNAAARRLYESLGFQAVGTREGYYHDPPEPGIVMTVFS